LFEAAAAAEAVNAAEHHNQHTAEDKNQPESVSREQQAKDAVQNTGPAAQAQPAAQTPLSAQKQELPGATAWDQIPDALRGLQSHPEHAQEHAQEPIDIALEQLIHGDGGNTARTAVQFQDLFADTPSRHRELVILNASVQDTDSIVADLKSGTDVLRLHGGEDALAQINRYLELQENVSYDAIHLVSHRTADFLC
jgi:hypothetical protein